MEETMEESVVTRICDKLGVRDLVVRERLQEVVESILSEEINKYKKEVRESIYGSECHTGIKDIINYVCERYLLEPSELDQKTRKRQIVEPRQIIHWMIRKRVSSNRMSLEKIGELVGKKDHATVTHSVKVVNLRAETEQSFRETLMIMCNELGARVAWIEHEKELKVTGYLKKKNNERD